PTGPARAGASAAPDVKKGEFEGAAPQEMLSHIFILQGAATAAWSLKRLLTLRIFVLYSRHPRCTSTNPPKQRPGFSPERHLSFCTTVATSSMNASTKEEHHVSRRSLRTSGRRSGARGPVLHQSLWLADQQVGRADGLLARSHRRAGHAGHRRSDSAAR